MKQEFTSEGWRDFQQRYQGTYGWYNNLKGSKVLVQVVSINEELVEFCDETGFMYSANADRGNFFEFIPVERALFNYEDDVLLCQRVANRQWRRGIHRANTEFMSLITGVSIPPDFKILQTVFGEKKGEKFLQDFLSGKRNTVALDESFALVGGKVYAYQAHIGAFDRPSGTLTLTTPVYEQELRDLMRDNMIPYSVRVQ